MALSAKARRAMPASKFGVPAARKYPIDTAARARNALGRVAQHGSAAQKAQVRKRVARKYPSIKVSGLKGKKR